MTIPSRADFLAEVDKQFRAHVPGAPQHVEPENPAHAGMIQRWRDIHNEVLYAWTDSVFFSYLPGAPKRLDPSNPEHSTMIEYWNDIAGQIRDGTPGRYNWSGTPDTSTASTSADSAVSGNEESDTPAQDGSVNLERGIEYVHTLLKLYVEILDGTPLAAKATDHVNKQIDTLRGLVKDGTFKTYSLWWRSPEFADTAWVDDDPMKEQLASIKDLTLEAKIDRKTGELDTHLAGWANNKSGDWFGRMSRAAE
jgi:hypothetical protein